MAFVYILRSQRDENLYVGATNDLEKRIATHNKGGVRSTKSRMPLILVFSKEFQTYSEALKFEWMLKNTPRGGKLKKRLASGKVE